MSGLYISNNAPEHALISCQQEVWELLACLMPIDNRSLIVLSSDSRRIQPSALTILSPVFLSKALSLIQIYFNQSAEICSLNVTNTAWFTIRLPWLHLLLCIEVNVRYNPLDILWLVFTSKTGYLFVRIWFEDEK